MGKLPYIPIYIGDWEQDTNCISIEAEGALLKLTFKLWKSETKGLLSISFSQIAILLKKSEEDAIKIVKELQENDILNIVFLAGNKIQIESRRMLKEVAISKIRSDAGSKGGRPEKEEKSKTKANIKQITENENEDINVNNNINNNKGIPDFLEFKTFAFEKKPNVCETDLKLKYDSWVTNGWKNGNDKKIKNWKSSLLNTLPYIKEGLNCNTDKPLKMVY